jgi:hypothetical protein
MKNVKENPREGLADGFDPEPAAKEVGNLKERKKAGPEREPETEQQRQARKKMLRMNYRTAVPFERILQHQAPSVKYTDLRNAKKEGKWIKLIRLGAQISLGKDNDVRGLGFTSKGLGQISSDRKLGILRQVEQIDQQGIAWQQKMKVSMFRAETELQLQREGYRRTGTATVSETLRIDGDRQTLESIMTSKFPDKPEIFRSIKNKTVLGPLSSSGELPAGTYLYFDTQGLPIHIAATSDEKPEVPMFVKDESLLATRKGSQQETLELLESRLQPGDVLFVNRQGKNAVKRAFATLGRMLQAKSAEDESFFTIHVMVYKGNGKIVHVRDGGGKEEALRDLMTDRYNSISVGRLQDPEHAKVLLKHADDITKAVDTYDNSRLSAMSTPLALRRMEAETGKKGNTAIPDRKSKNKAVCVDVVSEAADKTARQTGQPNELVGQKVALDMYKSLEIEYSLDIPQKK